MLKKLLYLYNDGHNPFPHMKGQGFGPVQDPNHPDRYDYMYYADDQMTQEEADRLNGILPELEEEYEQRTGNLAEIERLYPERFIPTVPTKQEYDIDKYIEKYEDEHPMEDYYEELEDINDEIKEIKNEINQTTKGDSIETYSNKLKLLDEEEKIEKKNIIKFRLQQQKINDSFIKLAEESDKEFDKSIKNLTPKQQQRFYDMFEDVVQKMNVLFKPKDETNDTELILTEANKIVRVTKQPINIILRTLYKDAIDSLNMRFIQNDKDLFPFFKRYAASLVKLAFPDEMKTLTELGRKELASKERLDELKDDRKYMTEKLSYIDIKNEEIKIKQKEYAERKKIIYHKKRLAEIKQLSLIDPEQALKDAAELNAELKEKEALSTGKKLSKAAEKKAKTAAKKAQAEKQAEAPVVNALSSLSSKGTYGKKLEDFFASDGQPILQKFTGDTSKIIDIESNGVIPNDEVQFTTKKKGPLNKACTLDLYNNNYVFEIKNYLDNSIKDDVIPMQPSKFRGTKYFIPTYLENGELYSFKLNYTDPKGKVYDKEILPYNDKGREVVFIIRLKEGLYQYKPFLDKKNNKLIPNGETTPDGRLLYYFDETKLKPCLDYYDEPAFNLKGHLTPI